MRAWSAFGICEIFKHGLRRIFWVSRVFGVALSGALARLLRRAKRLPPRIWHGFLPLHITEGQVLADRLADFPSRSVVMHSNPSSYALVKDKNFDRVVRTSAARWDDAHWLCLLDMLGSGDIWVANFDCHFFRHDQSWLNRRTFQLLRVVGIRTIVVPHGADVNHQARYISRYDWTTRYKRDYPDWDGEQQSEMARCRIEMFCSHADLVLGADSSLARFLPRNDLMFKYFPVDCDALSPRAGISNTRPVIAHAPNHRLTKGTDTLLASVERLIARGIELELRLVEKVPRDEALALYSEADVIADQFCIGAFGMFALEGLALGKPVLTYLDQEHLGDPMFNLPLINTTAENMDGVLAVLLQMPVLRDRIGAAGRSSVESYQSIPALSEVWSRIYRHVWWGKPLDLASTRHFSSERRPRSFTEDPSRADFWPVPVDDLLPEIHAALVRGGFPILGDCASDAESSAAQVKPECAGQL